MNAPANQLPQELPNPHRHETTDVRPISIGLFALGLALMLALVLPFLGGVFWQLESRAKQADPTQSPLATPPTFAGPKLQSQPATDLIRMRRQEDQRLSTYGWIDEGQKIVHLPIERAMSLLAERGFPEPVGSSETNERKDPKP